MSYNLKCCSFYPNNFDASALTQGSIVHVLFLIDGTQEDDVVTYEVGLLSNAVIAHHREARWHVIYHTIFWLFHATGECVVDS